MTDPKTHKLLLAEGDFPELQPGDCLMVTALQRPGYGKPPSVTLETHDAYPQGLDAGPYNEAHAGSPGDVERALKLQLGSLAERLGCRLVGPQEMAVLDAAAALPDRDLVTVAACPDPRDVGAALARAEVARRTGTTVAEVTAAIGRLTGKG